MCLLLQVLFSGACFHPERYQHHSAASLTRSHTPRCGLQPRLSHTPFIPPSTLRSHFSPRFMASRHRHRYRHRHVAETDQNNQQHLSPSYSTSSPSVRPPLVSHPRISLPLLKPRNPNQGRQLHMMMKIPQETHCVRVNEIYSNLFALISEELLHGISLLTFAFSLVWRPLC